MKKLVIALILCFPFSGVAQDLSNWQIGIIVNPFIFHRFYDNKPFDFAKQNYPNGIGVGLTVEKNWNERWGIKTGIEYTSQNIKYNNYSYGGNSYKANVKEDFNNFKIPLNVQYFYPLQDKLFLTFNQGLIFSKLYSYKSTGENSELFKQIYTPNNYEFISYSNSNYSNANWDYIYSRFNFGIIGSVGLKGFLAEKLTYSTSMRYEYDFTNSNNKYSPYESRDFNDPNAPVQQVRNFSIGFEFGLQYHFEKLIRFNKNPQ